MAVPTWLTEMGLIGTWAVGFLALFGDRIRCYDIQAEAASGIEECGRKATSRKPHRVPPRLNHR
jgi:hypothetical protein